MPKPLLPPGQARDVHLGIRLRSSEAQALADLAGKRNMTKSDLARELIVSAMPRPTSRDTVTVTRRSPTFQTDDSEYPMTAHELTREPDEGTP